MYIPDKLLVGFQNREDTYTGKLAYVIYWDQDDKLKKETSWKNWIDSNIPSETFTNEPQFGFVMNRKVGDYKAHFGHRSAHCRMFDPRGFEIEISFDNLLWILENTSSIKGKGLEGEFVYGWEGTELVLIPCASPDYQEHVEHSSLIKKKNKFTEKDMIAGSIYTLKDGSSCIYLGRFQYGDGETKLNKKEPKKFFLYPIKGSDIETTHNFVKTMSELKFVINDTGKVVPYDVLQKLIEMSKKDHKISNRDAKRDEFVTFTAEELEKLAYKTYKDGNKELHAYYVKDKEGLWVRVGPKSVGNEIRFLCYTDNGYFLNGIPLTSSELVQRFQFGYMKTFDYQGNFERFIWNPISG